MIISETESSDKILLLVSGYVYDEINTLKEIPENTEIEIPEKFSFNSIQNPFSSKIVYKAEKINEYGDYCISWVLGDGNKHAVEKYATSSEHYTEKEVKYYISTSKWVIKENV